jgi:hypothetical protein
MSTIPAPALDTDLGLGPLEQRRATYLQQMSQILDSEPFKGRHMASIRLHSLDADPTDKNAIDREIQLLAPVFDVQVQALRYPTDVGNQGAEGVLIVVAGEISKLSAFLRHAYGIPDA